MGEVMYLCAIDPFMVIPEEIKGTPNPNLKPLKEPQRIFSQKGAL